MATSTFTQLLSFRLNQFSSRRYTLRKCHIRPIPSLKRFPNVAFGAGRLIRLTDDGLPSSFQGRSSSASSFHVSLVHAIDGSVSLLVYVQDDHLDFHTAPESTEIVRSIGDGEPRTTTSTLTQLLSSVQRCFLSTEIVRSIGNVRAQEGHLNLHTGPEL